MRAWIILAVVVLVVLGGLAAIGSGLFPLDREMPHVERVSPVAAASAEVKLSQLDTPGAEVRLTAEELTSLFRYRSELWSLGIVREPTVALANDSVFLTGRIALADLPANSELDALRPLLPDTAPVRVSGRVRPVDAFTTVLELGGLQVAGMPIPQRFYTPFLDRMGQDLGGRLPAGTFALPLPPNIRSARVEDGHLVLTR